MLALKLGLSLVSSNAPSQSGSFENVYSLAFDGIDDYLDLGDADAFTPNNSGANRGFSMSFWIKTSSKSNQVLSKNISGDKEYGLVLRYNGYPRLALYSSDNNSIYQYLDINTDITDGNWHNIIFTFDLGSTSSSLVGYLDGVQNTDGSGATYGSAGTWVSVSNTAADLRIGYQGGGYGDISLDELAFFDDTLTSTQATTIYNSGEPNDLSSISNLIGWWRNGDTAGPSVYPTITDDSSNSNNGTMTNMDSGDIVTDVP